MIALVLLMSCASALGETQVEAPRYTDYQRKMHEAMEVLDKNIMSMAEAIPYMADSRRHYAEVIHVVTSMTNHLRGCLPRNYDQDYESVLNETAADGIRRPYDVVVTIGEQMNQISQRTGQLRSLMEQQCKNVHPKDCDRVIHDEVNSDPQRYQDEAEVLLATGRAASIFMNMAHEFEVASMRHSGHRYVVDGQHRLKELVMACVAMDKALHPQLC